MNITETTRLCRIIANLCPTQLFESHTPDAWAIVLDDVSYADAEQAVRLVYRDLGNDQEWGARKIEADDVLRGVRRLRNERVTNGPAYVPSRADMTTDEQLAEYRQHVRLLADGRHAPHDGHRRLGTDTIRRAITVRSTRVENS